MITLFGATGYTGRLIAVQLAKMDLPDGGLRLAGRSAEKLRQLAAELPNNPAWMTADVDDLASIKRLCQDSRVLVNCVGPFTDLGERVVAQAAMHGVHYLDTTNELGFVHRMQGYHEMALKNKAAIVPACAFEVALSDCAAAQLAKQIEGPIERVDIVYALGGGGSSAGTRRSAIRTLGTSWLGYRGGEWVAELPCRSTRWAALPRGLRRALSFPSSEIATMPKHLDVQEVEAWMVVSRRSSGMVRTMMPFFSVLARTPLGPLMAWLSVRLMPPPQSGLRAKASSVVVVEMQAGAESRRMVLETGGGYELTGYITAYAARQMAQPGYDRAGVLAPAQALDPAAFLRTAEEQFGVQVSVERTEENEQT